MKRKLPQEAVMNEADFAWWAWFWGEIEHWAFLVVVVALAIEFAALKFGAPYREKIEAAKDLKIAQLNNETARLRKQIAPRHIDSDVFLKALAGKPKAPVELMFTKEDGEAFQLALSLRDHLKVAEWTVTEPLPVPATDVARLSNLPSHMAAGGQPTGVALVARADSQEEFRIFGDREADTAKNALSRALVQSLGSVSEHTGGEGIFTAAPPSGVIRLVVGPK
jgi:hypothetical protein